MSLELAVKLARENPIRPKGRNSISRFCCIIVADRYRSFVGLNSYKSHPLQAKFASKAGNDEAICVHAEIAAIAKASKSGIVPHRCRIFVARVLGDGTPALAKPCCICTGAFREFGFNLNNIEWTR